MPITIPERTIDGVAERTLLALTAEHNRENGAALTPVDYYELRAGEFMRAAVLRVQERETNRFLKAVGPDFAAKFNSATPEQQQRAIAALDVTAGTV